MSLTAMVEEMPRPMLILMMVLGFIAFWPIGLAILGYMIWSGNMGCWKGRKSYSKWKQEFGGQSSSGNRAFDEYREATVKRLEDEQREFEMFLERLRQAKDQHQFDQFMSERNGLHPGNS